MLNACRLLLFVSLFVSAAHAQTLIQNPPCRDVEGTYEISLDDHPPCNVPVGGWPANTNVWEKAIACLESIVNKHGNVLPGAVIAYQKDGQAPLLHSYGAPGSDFAGLAATVPIFSIASMTKPIVRAATVKMVMDHHRRSSDCVGGYSNPLCVFPEGVNTRLRYALERLDYRNGTDVSWRWYNNRYLTRAGLPFPIHTDDLFRYDGWKNQVTIDHVLRMTSGFEEPRYVGQKLCYGECAVMDNPGDDDRSLCKASEHSPGIPPGVTFGPSPRETTECGHSLLYNRYLELRGDPSLAGPNAVPISDTCRPRPQNPQVGPRLFDFTGYYGGNPQHPTKLAQKYERRYAGVPLTFNECIYTENPANGQGQWVPAWSSSVRNIALFYLGTPLKQQPGVGFIYGQANKYIEAYLIEALHGYSYSAYMKRYLFTPAGMTDSFLVPNRWRTDFAPGGAFHSSSHGARDPNNHTWDEGGTTPQLERVMDIKRVPISPARVIPDYASPLNPGSPFVNADPNIDEGRGATYGTFPEGGMYASASDLLKYLGIYKGVGVLDAEMLAYLNPGGTFMDTIGRLGAYGTVFDRRNGRNAAVLASTMSELPNNDPDAAWLCDYQWDHGRILRSWILNVLFSIP